MLTLRALSTFGRFIVKTPLSPTCDTITSSSDSADEGVDACNTTATTTVNIYHCYMMNYNGGLIGHVLFSRTDSPLQTTHTHTQLSHCMKGSKVARWLTGRASE